METFTQAVLVAAPWQAREERKESIHPVLEVRCLLKVRSARVVQWKWTHSLAVHQSLAWNWDSAWIWERLSPW